MLLFLGFNTSARYANIIGKKISILNFQAIIELIGQCQGMEIIRVLG